MEPKLNLDSDLVSLMEHFDSKEDLHISTMPSEIVNACWQFDRGQSVLAFSLYEESDVATKYLYI